MMGLELRVSCDNLSEIPTVNSERRDWQGYFLKALSIDSNNMPCMANIIV